MRRPILLALTLVMGCTGTLDDDGVSGPAGTGHTSPPPSCTVPTASVTEMRRLTEAQYASAIHDIFDGLVTPSPQFPPAGTTGTIAFSTEAARYYPSEASVERVMLAAEDVGVSVADALPTLLTCSTTHADDACVSELIDRYLRRAYRHTPTASERTALLASYHDARTGGASFGEGIAIMVVFALQTPQFLYVAEDAGGTGRPLSGVEMASRLSFLFWDAVPDDELLDAAEGGQLATSAGVRTQAERLFASPRADEAIARFFREWSGVRRVDPTEKSSTVYPQFDGTLSASIDHSFDQFVVGQMRHGTLRGLLRSTQYPADATLGSLFGVTPAADGTVTLDPTRYTGLFTHPAFLASMAKSVSTRYVYRGRFVRRDLLCETLGAPPANAQAQFGALSIPADATAREESNRVTMSCGGACHGQINPAGLALEHFGAIGEWRDGYTTGRAIDVTGTLQHVAGGDISFEGPVDMMEALTAREAVRTCFARQVFRFAMSRVDDTSDTCIVDGIAASFATPDAPLAGVLVELATSDAYRSRRDPNP